MTGLKKKVICIQTDLLTGRQTFKEDSFILIHFMQTLFVIIIINIFQVEYNIYQNAFDC